MFTHTHTLTPLLWLCLLRNSICTNNRCAIKLLLYCTFHILLYKWKFHREFCKKSINNFFFATSILIVYVNNKTIEWNNFLTQITFILLDTPTPTKLKLMSWYDGCCRVLFVGLFVICIICMCVNLFMKYRVILLIFISFSFFFF